MRDQVTTYLLVNGRLVAIDHFAGKLPDESYVEGAIECSIAGVAILTREECDLVDQLWAYIVDGLTELTSGRDFECYFPDQPLRLAFKRVDEHHVLVVVGNRSQTVEVRRLTAAVKAGAVAFFEKMLHLHSDARSTWLRYRDAAAALTCG